MPLPPQIDAHRLLPRLWQGAFPPPGQVLALAGFQVLALCAKELQRPELFPDLSLALCPLDDGLLTELDLARAQQTSARLLTAWRAGDRVLVTCAQGRNRSGLVCALMIREVLDCSGPEAARHVQHHRPYALRNPSFNGYLAALGKPSASSRPRAARPKAQSRRLPVALLAR